MSRSRCVTSLYISFSIVTDVESGAWQEGGTYSVRVSLISVALLLRSLGRHSPACFLEPGLALPEKGFPPSPEIAALLQDYAETGGGGETRRKLRALKHAGVIEGLEARNTGAPMKVSSRHGAWSLLMADKLTRPSSLSKLDADLPEWLDSYD